jgi:ABC-type polysaccharide/polyol phosphate transport system ATPase subunit
MELIKLNNVGRKFQRFIKADDFSNDQTIFRNINSKKGDFWALRNIYMSINQTEVVGIIGRNGSGKSTLLNIIAGVLPVSEGEIIINGRVSALLSLGVGFQDEFTGKENIYLNASLLGLTRKEIDERFTSILEFSELGDFINAPLGSYSAGMKMRLGFSTAIHKDFDILITDEIISVGDIYFQKKCFEKMIDFKRQGKAIIVVAQDMGFIDRFCDRVYLLEDGKVLFNGKPKEAIELYQVLLNKKKVLSEGPRSYIVTETKRMATDMPEWGRREGTKEAIIKNIQVFNKWGFKTDKVKCGQPIIVRADFTVQEEIDNFHFGIAIFREDGVYCYGPNTQFDGLPIGRVSLGEGYFEIHYKELLLMPGIYYFSVAIWDERETFAFDYHKCRCKIEIVGSSSFGQLVSLPSRWATPNLPDYSIRLNDLDGPRLDFLADKWGTEFKTNGVNIESIKCLDNYGSEDSVFITGKETKIKIDFKIDEIPTKNLILWLGIYRSDRFYCHGSTKPIIANGSNSEILIYPKMRLLPGGYNISAGVWDNSTKRFIAYTHGICSFNIISDKYDHGTVYMEHRWKWKIPKGGKIKK